MTYLEAHEAFLKAIRFVKAAAIGEPREKIRIEPVETPVPSKTPAPVEVPQEKEPVR